MKCILAYEEIDFSRPFASPCCHIMPDEENLHIKNIINLNDLLHSKTYQRVRNTMLENKKDSICDVCWNIENINGVSDRQIENHIRKDRETIELRSLKIALDYTCNMMCRICTPMLSSKWNSAHQLKKEINHIDDYSVAYPKYDVKQIITNSDISKLERIKILGGEPFYSKKLEWFIEYLQQKTDYKNLQIYITTNGSVFPNKKLLEKLLACKKLHIEFSIDAVGDLSKLCRWGVNWNIIDTNLKQWAATKDVINSVHCSVSVYNINKLSDLITYCNENKLWLNFNKVRYPKHLSIDMIDIDTRKNWMLKSNDVISQQANKIIILQEEDNTSLKNKFIEFNNSLDKFQKEQLKDLNKEIYEYFYQKS